MTEDLEPIPRRCGDALSYSERLSGAAEAAVLVAANHAGVAELLLRGAVDARSEQPPETPWLMLFEILRSAGRRAEFDALLHRYHAAFGVPGPAWGLPQPIVAPNSFPLAGVLGASREDLDGLARFAYGRKSVVVDMSEVERIDYAFVHALQALLAGFGASGKRVILANVAEAIAVLLETVGADRHVVVMRRHRRASAPLAKAA
jgi:anti-anti-sigma regulatory factor